MRRNPLSLIPGLRHLPLLFLAFPMIFDPRSIQAQPAIPAQPAIQPQTAPVRFDLWPSSASAGKSPGTGDAAAITVYSPAPALATKTAIIVCPGGGYQELALAHEGRQIAVWLNSLGVTALVLEYRYAPKFHHPIPLQDAQRAIRFARSHAEEWKFDPGKLGILGFSAGGHLASSAGTMFDQGSAEAADPIERLSSRPDFLVLLYPVITLSGPFAHTGSRNNLLGKGAAPELIGSLSTQTRVTAETPPSFLVHTEEDDAVPAENSLLFYEALLKFHVPAELHVYEKGGHGLGLGPPNLPYSGWPTVFAGWMRGRGLLEK